MALTSISGPVAYCTPQQMVHRYDARTIGQYLSDDGIKLTVDEVLASPILSELLQEASGELETALLRGGRYTPADLGNLTGNGLEMLAGMVAGYAMFLIWDRRPGRFSDHQLPLRAQIAVDKFQDLATGHRILPFQEAADAGRIHHEVEAARKVFDRRLCAVIAIRSFGLRGNEMFPPVVTPFPFTTTP
jgi:hypothetical protein